MHAHRLVLSGVLRVVPAAKLRDVGAGLVDARRRVDDGYLAAAVAAEHIADGTCHCQTRVAELEYVVAVAVLLSVDAPETVYDVRVLHAVAVAAVAAAAEYADAVASYAAVAEFAYMVMAEVEDLQVLIQYVFDVGEHVVAAAAENVCYCMRKLSNERNVPVGDSGHRHVAAADTGP